MNSNTPLNDQHREQALFNMRLSISVAEQLPFAFVELECESIIIPICVN